MSLTRIWHKFLGGDKPPMTSKQANDLLGKALRRRNVRLAERALIATASPNIVCTRYDSDHEGSVYTVPALWEMASKGDAPMVRLLLKFGAQTETVFSKRTALMEAVLQGHTPVVRALLDAGAKTEVWCYGDSLLACAQQKQFADIIKMIKEEPDRRSQIMAAAAQARQEAEAQRLAAIDKAKQEAEARAAAPPEQTVDAVQIMKPLTFKTAKRKGLFG
ncbi:MAG: ankyrin repeat domain-containing protein [Alphaproteobacteria bacterium]